MKEIIDTSTQRRIIIIGLFVLIYYPVNHLFAQNKDTAYSEYTAVDEIPFELTKHNNIVVKGLLNGLDTVRLMFHTAANSVTLIQSFTQTVKSIEWNSSYQVKSWGGSSEARFSPFNSLQIGNTKMDSISIWENKNSGPTSDGKFGPDFFKNKVIEIDFKKRYILLYDFIPEKVNDFLKIPIRYENDMMFIAIEFTIGEETIKNLFLIHTGYGGHILLDEELLINHENIVTETRALKDSYGNIVNTRKGILPDLSIGNLKFQDVAVEFFEGSIGGQKVNIIGGDFLRKFHLIIDANRQFLYLKVIN